MSRVDEFGCSASQALLSAALSGLLCVAAVSCSSSSSLPSGGSVSQGTTDLDGGSVSQGTTDPDTPVPATECDGGVSPDPTVTSSMVVANMTQAEFVSQCNADNGIFEIQPHCGGSNACRGMSYDTELQELIEHTCRGQNSCAGYSCVVCN